MVLSANPQFEVLFNEDLLAILESAIELEQDMSSENDISITNLIMRAQQKVSQTSSLFKSNANTLPQKLIDLNLLEDVSTLNLARMRLSETIVNVSDAGYSIYDKGIAQQETATIAKLTSESVLDFLNNLKKLQQFKTLKNVEAINALQSISQQLPEIIRAFSNLIRSLIKAMTKLTDDELSVLEDIRYDLLNNQRLIKQYFEEAKSIWMALSKPTTKDSLFDQKQFDIFIDTLTKSEATTLVGQVNRKANQDASYTSQQEIINQVNKISNALISTSSMKSFSYMITNLDAIWATIQLRIRAKREQKITTTDLISSINHLLDNLDSKTLLGQTIPFTNLTHDIHQNDRFQDADQTPIFTDNFDTIEKVIALPTNRTYHVTSRVTDEAMSQSVTPSLPDYMFLQRDITALIDENKELEVANNIVVPSFSVRDWIWSIQNKIINHFNQTGHYPTTISDDRLHTKILLSKIHQTPVDIITLENNDMLSEISYSFTIKIN